MLALPAVASPGRGVCLGAEDSDLGARGTSRARRAVRPHPFAVGAERLAEHVPVPDATPGQAVLLLPSRPDAPADSAVLQRDETPPPRGPLRLAAWSVPVLEVGAHVPDSPDGVTESASVTVLRALVDAATGLVARGRILPALVDDQDDDHPDQDDDHRDPELRWRPVLQGPDLIAADAFAAALPPVARAEQGAGGDGERELDATTAVAEVLAVAVDAEARRRLADLPADDAPGWLAALTGPEPGGSAALPDGLAVGLGRWSVVGAPHAGPARATFRLVEVVADEFHHAFDDAEPRFRLEFALQATQDPSLVVEADTVWRDGASLRRWLDEPSELLLSELGRAARVYPELADALRVARPTGMELDRAGAHRFLAEAAADLDRAGFGVLLPSWWSRPSRLGLAARAEGPEGVVVTSSQLTRDHMVDFSWRLAVDGEALTDDEMAALVAAKAPLVRLRGRWVAVDPERLRAGLDFLESHPDGATEMGAVLHLAAAHPADLGTDLPIESVDADGELGALLAGAPPSDLALLDAPPEVDATLRPYQRRGLSWLAFLAGLGVGGVLADDMGLGKTLQVLALEALERAPVSPIGVLPSTPGRGTDSRSQPMQATLLVCPTSMVTTWRREAARFVPSLRVAIHHGAGRDRDGVAGVAAEHDLVVTSYGTLTRDVEPLAAVGWHRVVLDEAQLVKNNRSRAARAVRGLRAEHRLALTGTPVENRLAELWSIMDAVNPGLLGSVSDFRERYAVPVERHGRTDVARALRTRIRPFLLRRLKTDPTVVDDLPEKIETIERCTLGPEQASLYQAAVDEMLEKVADADEGVERRGRVLAGMTKLKQICDHPALMLGDGSAVGRRSGKIARVEELLAEILAAGERTLLFTQFKAFGDMLAPHLAARFDTEVAWLHGGTSRPARDRMVERFQSGPEDGNSGPSIFLLSLRAGGTGLTLTAASHVVHLDRWWNPAVEDQATDRAFRIGQRRTVNVRKLVCTGTLEERIDDLISGKRALADLAVTDGEDWLSGLSTDELARVVSLDRDAAGSEPEDPDEADAGSDSDPGSDGDA